MTDSSFGLQCEKKGDISLYTSEELLQEEAIFLAFTTRNGGVSFPPYESLNLAYHVGDLSSKVTRNREKLFQILSLDSEKLTVGEQVHGDQVAIVDEKLVGKGSLSEEDAIPKTDALITNLLDIPLAVLVADCLPIILVDIEKRVVAAVHAGRCSTELGIVEKTLKKMVNQFESLPQNILAFIGPGIGTCCYKLDLIDLNREQLIECGVSESFIHQTGVCTSCRDDIFFSYRAQEGKAGRQMGLVSLVKNI